jgi:hypothetical protein
LGNFSWVLGRPQPSAFSGTICRVGRERNKRCMHAMFSSVTVLKSIIKKEGMRLWPELNHLRIKFSTAKTVKKLRVQ